MHATADQLRRVTRAILKSGGSAAPEADLVADHLVQANLAGHDSHGVGMIPAYVRHLKAGLVVPNTRAKLVKDDGALLMFDGGRGYGRPVAGEAMAAAIARCGETGIVALTLANAHHIGRVGAYGEMASRGGLVSLHFVNVTDHRGLVAPFRGTDARVLHQSDLHRAARHGASASGAPRHGHERRGHGQGAHRPERGQARARGDADRPAWSADA